MIGLSRSSYYYKRKTDPDEKLRSDMNLRDDIEKVHLKFPGYGYRRLYKHFLKQGKRINHKRIKRIMKTYELYTCLKKFMKPRGTHSEVPIVYPNLIKGLEINAPNQVWATDITYIKLLREFIYLAAILDVYTRKIVGWAISRNLSHKFCLEALKVAIKREKPSPGIIHHSDRGVQYVCEDYVKYLIQNKFKVSMSKSGSPNENAFIESFFKTLKREEVYVKDYKTLEDVIKNLPNFIDEVYNKERMHSSLGYISPMEYEQMVLNIKIDNRPTQKIWGKTV